MPSKGFLVVAAINLVFPALEIGGRVMAYDALSGPDNSLTALYSDGRMTTE